MKVYRTELQPAKSVSVLDKTICDLCGKEIEPIRTHETDEVQMSRRWGTSYPEGGSGQEISADLHGECFMRVVEWLRSQGAELAEREWDCWN